MHPMKGKSKNDHNAKLRKMTRDYGSASGPANNKLAPTNMMKGEGPEEAAEFGADSNGMPGNRADRVMRGGISNPIATLKRGGSVKARAHGGRLKKGATNVTVVVAPQSGAPAGANPAMPMPPPMGAAPPPKPPMGPAGLPPGAAGLPMAPGAPGGLPPGLIPPRAAGGAVNKSLDAQGLKRDAVKSDGGKIRKIGMTAGAVTGEGRLEKAAAQRKLSPQAV